MAGRNTAASTAHRLRPKLRLRRRGRRVLARESAPQRHSQGRPSTTRLMFAPNRSEDPSSSGFIANYRDRIPLPPEVLGSVPTIGARSCLSIIGSCKTTFPRPDRREALRYSQGRLRQSMRVSGSSREVHPGQISGGGGNRKRQPGAGQPRPPGERRPPGGRPRIQSPGRGPRPGGHRTTP